MGSTREIEDLIKSAWKGPKRARVAKVQVSWFHRETELQSGLLQGVEKEDQAAIPWSKETARRITSTLKKLPYVMEKPNAFGEDIHGEYSNASAIYRAAQKRNLFITRFLKNTYLVSPQRRLGLQNAQSTLVSSTTRSITTHKQLTKELLSYHGIPVPKGALFTDLQSAQEYFSTCHYPLVVKPVTGSYGRGITVDVRTGETFLEAWHDAQQFHQGVMVEEFLAGLDIRVLIIGGAAACALLRVPAHVVGNGRDTITTLVDKKNRERMANWRLCKAPIIPDTYTERYLLRQGYTLAGVPAVGEVVFLHLKANIGTGADSIGITESIHPGLLGLAEEAAEALGVHDFLGVDLLVEQLDAPPQRQRCVVLEVNTKANIINVQYPLFGEPVHAAQLLIDHHFPEEMRDDAYPEERIRLRLTGSLDRGFSRWFSEKAQDLQLAQELQIQGETGEALLSGRRHQLLFLLDQVLDWKGPNREHVDGLQVFLHSSTTGGPFFLGQGRKKDRRDREGVLSQVQGEWSRDFLAEDSRLDMTTRLFLQEFRRRGYTARPFFDALLQIQKGNRIGITGMRHSTLFCDRVLSRGYQARRLLALHGFPVPRGGVFRMGEKKQALDLLTRLSGSLFLTGYHRGGQSTRRIQGKKELSTAWEEARRRGWAVLFLEEIVAGRHICLPVVAGRGVGAMLKKPSAIQGDGRSTVRELIGKKNQLRRENPWYQKTPMKIDVDLEKRIGPVSPDQVLEEGTILYLETADGFEWGGEMVNIDERLHRDFFLAAVQAVEVFVGLEYAVVQLKIPFPEREAEGQRWVIQAIDSNPAAGAFHFPWQGRPCTLVDHVVSHLCLRNRTTWMERAFTPDDMLFPG